MPLLSPLRNFFHLGYVVLDLEKVMRDMRDQFGVKDWKIVPLPEGAPAKAIAFAYVNGTMTELVELDLNQEPLPIHRGWIPQSVDCARLNHVAYLLDSSEELNGVRIKNEAAGIVTAWLDSFGDIFSTYYYADTTARLGHFTEFLCLGPAGRDFLAQVPRN